MVSFDVESLFTNVPGTEACDIIKTRLQQDTTLDTRTALSREQIHDLLLTCLNETSFQWRDGYYKQLQGAAMGSPLSPIVANIFMEEFETSALQQATHQPKLWLRYVDDTFIIWQHSKQQLDNFFQHLNNQHSNIKFTMETEDQGSLPFLDVHITKATDSHLTHQVYRKPTHTDRYLHYRSFHHPSVLQSVSSTLIKQAHDLSDKQHLQQELQHIKSTLTTINGYPSGKIKVRPPRPQPTTPALTRVTYMGKTSHKLQRILKNRRQSR